MSWDGKIYDKYRIEHTDGTPLKGKKYFVLRLDSDDPVEAARVAAAMRAYKNEPRQCDIGTAKEQEDRFKKYCRGSNYCAVCPIRKLWDFQDGHSPSCTILWSQMPYEAREVGAADADCGEAEGED